MLNLSDKELDRLSREAAEKYEVDQGRSAWHRLEHMLDKELGRPSPIPRLFRPRMFLFYTPAILLLIGATYFLTKTSKHTSTSTQKEYTSVSGQPAVNMNRSVLPAGKVTAKNAHGTGSIQTVPLNATASAKKQVPETEMETSSTAPADKTHEKLSEKNNKKAVSVNTSTGRNQPTENNQNALVALPTPGNDHAKKFREKNNREEIAGKDAIEKTGKDKQESTTTANLGNTFDTHLNKVAGKKHAKPGKNTQLPDDKKTGEGLSVAGNKLVTKNDQQKAVNNNSSRELKLAVKGGREPLFDNTGFMINDSVLKNLQMNTSATARDIVTPGKKQKGRTLYTNRSLQFGVVFAPDFSEVRYNYNNKIGSNIGITVSYQLPGKFSVNSGFIFTKKNYDANGHDFHLPPNCGIDQDNLDFAICTSHIYEIPLNIRYDVNKAGNTSFFVSAGLSSYIMKKENFRFYLHDNSIGYRRWQNATYDIHQDYWLSVLNLSFGFETRISNSFSIQTEPYLKLPLTGIGFGSVDLNSYGVNISLKYAPVLKRSRR